MPEPTLLDLFNRIICEATRESIATFWLGIEENERDKCHEELSKSSRIPVDYAHIGDRLVQRLEDRRAKVATRKAEIFHLSEERSNATQKFLTSLSSQLTAASSLEATDLTELRRQFQANAGDVASLHVKLREIQTQRLESSKPTVEGKTDSPSAQQNPAEDIASLRTMIDDTHTSLAKMDGESEATQLFVEEMVRENAQRDVLVQRHEENLATLLAQNNDWKVKIDKLSDDVEARLQNAQTLVQSVQDMKKDVRSTIEDISGRLSTIEEISNGFKSKLMTTSLSVSDMERNIQDCHDKLGSHVETLKSVEESIKSQPTTAQVNRLVQEAGHKLAKDSNNALSEAEDRILNLEGGILKLATDLERLRTHLSAYQAMAVQGNITCDNNSKVVPSVNQPAEAAQDAINATLPPSAHYFLPVEQPPASTDPNRRSALNSMATSQVPEPMELSYEFSPRHNSQTYERLREEQPFTPQRLGGRERLSMTPHPHTSPFGNHPPYERVETSPTRMPRSTPHATHLVPPHQYELPLIRPLFRPLADRLMERNIGGGVFSEAVGATVMNNNHNDSKQAAHGCLSPIPTLRVHDYNGGIESRAGSAGNEDNLDTRMTEVQELTSPETTKTVAESSMGGTEVPQTTSEHPNHGLDVGVQALTSPDALQVNGHRSEATRQFPNPPPAMMQTVEHGTRKRSRHCCPFNDFSDSDEDESVPKSAAVHAQTESTRAKPNEQATQKKRRLHSPCPAIDKSKQTTIKALPTAKLRTDSHAPAHDKLLTTDNEPSRHVRPNGQTSDKNPSSQNGVRTPAATAHASSGIGEKRANESPKSMKSKDKHHGNKNDKAQEHLTGVGKGKEIEKTKAKEPAKPSTPVKPKPEPRAERAFEPLGWPATSRENPIELD